MIRAWLTLSHVRVAQGLRRGRERGQPAGDPGRQTAARTRPSEEGHRHREHRDREQRPDPRGAGIDGQGWAAEAGEPARSEGDVRWAGRAHRLAGGRTGRCDGIAGQDDAAWVVDRDDEPVCGRLDPPDRVQRIVRLDQRQELESGAAEHDPADRGPVIEREPIGPKVDDEATDADQLARERRESVEVRVNGR